MLQTGHAWDFDVAVVGGGSGGYAAARTAAAAGLRTAVIEGGAEVGGLCILRGCMPTKALLHAGDVLHLVRHASTWGIQAGAAGFDLAEIMARKDRLIQEFADYRRGQLTAGKFSFVRSAARFEDPHTLSLGEGRRLTAAHFVLATGSVVSPPPLRQLAEVGYLTSDDAIHLRRLPESLIVLGGGAVAMEFVQFFARLGVRVTVLQRSGQLLRDFDVDAAGEIARVLEREGVAIHCDTRLTGAFVRSGRKVVQFLQAGRPVEVEAEEIFFGLGRMPNTAGLALERAGVTTTEAGRIVTDAQMRTSVPHIHAAGDCTGPHEIVHVAIQQGEIAAHNIIHPERPRTIDYRLLTSVVFTDPQVAVVGMTEKQAVARGLPFLQASYRFEDHGKSLIMEARDGFVKLLADPVDGAILGGCVVGPMGGELIHEVIAAMAGGMTVRALAAMPHYHPTLAEIWTYPAEELADRIESEERQA